MKIGTRSLLFGVHQFLWHPVTVTLAWRKLYGRWPGLYEAVAIFCHDLGYWGKPNMDGPEGRTHPEAGARIARRIVWHLCFVRSWFVLFRTHLVYTLTWSEFFPSIHAAAADVADNISEQVGEFTILHSSNYAKVVGKEPSPLCWADKYAVLCEPRWFYLFRARLSGELAEYLRNAPHEYRSLPPVNWLRWYQHKVAAKVRDLHLLTDARRYGCPHL